MAALRMSCGMLCIYTSAAQQYMIGQNSIRLSPGLSLLERSLSCCSFKDARLKALLTGVSVLATCSECA